MNISGIRNGQAVSFRLMYFPDTPIRTLDVQGRGQWLITGQSSAEMGVVMSGDHIHGHFVGDDFHPAEQPAAEFPRSCHLRDEQAGLSRSCATLSRMDAYEVVAWLIFALAVALAVGAMVPRE